MYITRSIESRILSRLSSGKVSIIYGARRVGKTSLIKNLINQIDLAHLWLNGELPEVQEAISQKQINIYKNLISNNELLVIDEAQEIPDIGKALKIIVDEFPNLKIIASGSSAFDLSNNLGEPLVGRSFTYKLYSFAQLELINHENLIQTKQKRDERLIYGSYPELYFTDGFDHKEEYLLELVNSYLLKDIISYEGIRNSNKILDLIKLVAFQVGKEVSHQELGRQLGMSKNTVEKYLDLLEKVFVLKNVKGFSKNLRKEITKSSRWYFWDNGIRNALLNDFRLPNIRTDKGELWENYLMIERLKNNDYSNHHKLSYFWRTYDQQEIDLIETKNNQIEAFEFKWGSKLAKIPKAFYTAYPEASFETINEENYLDFIA